MDDKLQIKVEVCKNDPKCLKCPRCTKYFYTYDVSCNPHNLCDFCFETIVDIAKGPDLAYLQTLRNYPINPIYPVECEKIRDSLIERYLHQIKIAKEVVNGLMKDCSSTG